MNVPLVIVLWIAFGVFVGSLFKDETTGLSVASFIIFGVPALAFVVHLATLLWQARHYKTSGDVDPKGDGDLWGM